MLKEEMLSNVGKNCYVLETCPDWHKNNYNGGVDGVDIADRNTHILGVINGVVGDENNVILTCLSYAVFKPYFNGGYSYAIDSVYNKEIWRVHPNCIKIVEPIKYKNPNPYDTKCDKCYSPFYSKIGLCSNLKYKSRRLFKQKIK